MAIAAPAPRQCGRTIGGILLRASFVWLCAAAPGALLVALLLAWHPKVRLNPG